MPKNKKYLSWLQKKLKKQAPPSGSTGMKKDELVSYQHQQSATPSSFSLHRSITTLPYDNFIRVITGEDLKPLIIDGEPPVDELVSAWDSISEEYSNAIKTNKAKGVFEAYKKVVRIEAQIKMIDACLFYMENEYDEEIAQILYEAGYHHIQPNDNRKEYLKSIERVRTQAKTLIVVLNQAVAAYKLLAPTNELKVERDYQGFLDELAILGKFQGYNIRPKEITVAEYCAIVNSYIAYVEANKKNVK